MPLITREPIDFYTFYRIVFLEESVQIDDAVIKEIDGNFQFLNKFSKDKILYGITTGFGPMAQYRVNESEAEQLQYNLIRSHSAGSGKHLKPLLVRAVLLARLSSLSKGHSGIHPEVIKLLAGFINKKITPVLMEHGGVGASGDLVQLAHLALNLIGEGEVYYQGQLQPTNNVLEKLGLSPLKIHCREGLAMLNGTSAMTGIGLVNLTYAKNLLYWSVLISSIINEVVRSFDDHYSEALNSVKPHKGQQKIASLMREYLKDSKLIDKRHRHLFKKSEQEVFDKKVQEYYSLRCVPQILGPISDTLEYAQQILIDELNSVNDNPIVHEGDEYVYHGGNFHGDYVSMEMDKMKIAITKLCILAERQINFLVNQRLNKILPNFINHGKLGLNLGIQGLVFTATSTTAENQTLAYPMYLHSIPNNNDNQDVVSMGANAAQITSKVIENAHTVLAIEMIAVLQAIDYLKVQNKLSSVAYKHYNALRELVPCIVEDVPMYEHIAKVRNYIRNTYINGL